MNETTPGVDQGFYPRCGTIKQGCDGDLRSLCDVVGPRLRTLAGVQAVRCLIAALLLFGCASGAAQDPGGSEDEIGLIFDTDLGPDSDDAGALALIHALVERGEARLLGVNCSTLNPWCAPAADVINTYYGRPDIPIGTLKGPGSSGTSAEWYGDSFNGYLAGRFPNRVRHGEFAEDAVALYRKLLAGRPDTATAIVVTGPLTNVRDLLDSGPDAYSSLRGREIVQQKVKLLSVMGGQYPDGAESNFISDGPAASRVVAEWPGPIMFSGFEIGVDLLTGARLWAEAGPDNPVREAYHLWDLYFARRFEPDFDPSTGIWPHSSYDQTSVLYAVRGLRNYWDAETDGHNQVLEDGSNRWIVERNRDHAYLTEKMPREQLAGIIEELMIAPPR